MPKPISPSEFEKLIETVATVPEPEAQFNESLRERFILEGHTRANPIQEKPMRRKLLSPRLAWSLVVLLIAIVIVLISSPKVAQALKRLFGYVPDVGIVEQTSSLRMLTEPITVTRDTATVTVERAVLNVDKTLILYSYRLPAYDTPPDAKIDERAPSLLLSNGTRLKIKSGHRVNTLDCPDCGVRYEMEFDPIPADVNEVTLELPSLIMVPIGIAPQDWTIAMHFKPAAPEDVLPVVEVQPTSTSAPTLVPETAQPTQIPNPYGVSISMDKSVSLPNGYILYGSTRWTDKTIQPYKLNVNLIAIKDANGKDIPFDYAQADMSPGQGELVQYWAYQLNATPLAGPVSLSFVLDAFIPVDGSFTFDPGSNPRVGQTWNLNMDVPVNNHVVHIISADYGTDGQLNFLMKADTGIVGAQLKDSEYPFVGGGGGGAPVDEQVFGSSFNYLNGMPATPRTIAITDLDILILGDWQISWMPEK